MHEGNDLLDHVTNVEAFADELACLKGTRENQGYYHDHTREFVVVELLFDHRHRDNMNQ